MKRTTFTLALTLLPLAACDTIAPEDYDRRISMNWSLSPDNDAPTRRTVEAGDIIVSWTAQAKATHMMDGPTGPVPLVTARTSYGQLYCSKQTCHEDRDGDGKFDYVWKVSYNGAAPGEARTVTNPKPLETPISFRAATGSGLGSTVFQQILGLVYTGPLEGLPKDDASLVPMVGELTLGWHAGEKAPRTPDGAGWSAQQSIPLIIIEGFAPNTTVKPLGLTYKAVRATIDGMLDLEFQATKVDDIDLTAKQKFDVEEKPPENLIAREPAQT